MADEIIQLPGIVEEAPLVEMRKNRRRSRYSNPTQQRRYVRRYQRGETDMVAVPVGLAVAVGMVLLLNDMGQECIIVSQSGRQWPDLALSGSMKINPREARIS